MKKLIVRPDSYYDSVFLMQASQEAKRLEGVKDAVVAMATEMNRELLTRMGFRSPELASARPNDLVIAVEAASEEVANAALEGAERILRKRATLGREGEHRPASLEGALREMPDANMAVISVPGAHAAREAAKALARGLHVMLFSDNVSMEDEIRLKRMARERGLLLMGPDCGTAIINGKPLGFADAVRRGSIGIVAAAGTGLQEVACCIDRLGGGISQAIGTGGRDLKDERIGGATMLMGIEALAADPATRVIVVVSKPPAAAVAERVMKALESAGKPVVVHFQGLAPRPAEGAIRFAANLEETAGLAVALAQGTEYRPRMFSLPEREVEAIIAREVAGIGPRQKYLRGLFSGGTLADEAVVLLDGPLGGVFSNTHPDPERLLADPHVSRGHTILDLGDDVFTVGRPHPMIDPSLRCERLAREAEDPEVAVVLFDMVLGFSAHPDPAGPFADALARAKERFEARGGYLCAVGSVTGTAGDPQGLEAQQRALRAAGAVLMPSNYQAVMLAKRIMERLAARRGAAAKARTKAAPAARTESGRTKKPRPAAVRRLPRMGRSTPKGRSR